MATPLSDTVTGIACTASASPQQIARHTPRNRIVCTSRCYFVLRAETPVAAGNAGDQTG